MIIENINIISFGKLKNLKIPFSEGLNIIYGGNESGKTTIAAFIEAMFYSFPPRSDRSKYLPWDNSTAAGEMSVKTESSSITFYREFAKTPKGDILKPKDFSLADNIPATREDYRKSIYSPEGNMSFFGTTESIESKISNMLTSGDENITVSKAIKNLEKLRRELNAGGKTKSMRSAMSALEEEYYASQQEDINLKKIKSDADSKKASLNSLKEQISPGFQPSVDSELASIEQEIKSQTEYISQFPQSDAPPQKPYFFKKSFIFCIICTALLLIISIFSHPLISFIAVVPILTYLITYLHRLKAYSSSLSAFLTRVNCISLDEYSRMNVDFEQAKHYYNTLLKKKSDILALHKEKSAQRDLIYQNILALSAEIEAMEQAAHKTYRETSVIAEDISYLKNEYNELQTKLSAVNAAIESFNHAKSVISTDFTPVVAKKAMEYIDLIAPYPGREVSLSQDMSLKVTDPLIRDISSYSYGFRQEVYFAYRIAWSEFLYGNKFPLILDDPYIGSDDARSESLTEILYKISQTRQIIIFTNRKNILFNQIPCNLVDIATLNGV